MVKSQKMFLYSLYYFVQPIIPNTKKYSLLSFKTRNSKLRNQTMFVSLLKKWLRFKLFTVIINNNNNNTNRLFPSECDQQQDDSPWCEAGSCGSGSTSPGTSGPPDGARSCWARGQRGNQGTSSLLWAGWFCQEGIKVTQVETEHPTDLDCSRLLIKSQSKI